MSEAHAWLLSLNVAAPAGRASVWLYSTAFATARGGRASGRWVGMRPPKCEFDLALLDVHTRVIHISRAGEAKEFNMSALHVVVRRPPQVWQ